MGDARYLPEHVTLVVGGHGKTARHLTELLTASHHKPHIVYSIIRDPTQIPDLEAIGARPIVQDLVSSSMDDFRKIFEQARPDTVVWAASNPRAPVEVDRDGAIKIMDALAQADIPSKRYVVISAADIRDRENRPIPDWYSDADVKLSDRMWGIIGPALRAKFEADRDLVTQNERRKLKYTIIRPGGLTDDDAKERLRAGKVGLAGMISRANLAKTVRTVIENSHTEDLAFDVHGSGENDLPIEDAVKRVADKREDTFEGYY
jgi:nucleoside-diphosphate-sugar epimerase